MGSNRRPDWYPLESLPLFSIEAPWTLWKIELTVFSECSRNFEYFERNECRRKNIECYRSIWVAIDVHIYILSRSTRFFKGIPVVSPKYRIDGFFWIFAQFGKYWKKWVSEEEHRVQSINMGSNRRPHWYPLKIRPISSIEAPGPLWNIELTVFSEGSRNFEYFERNECRRKNI